jgi:hypothetical protein
MLAYIESGIWSYAEAGTFTSHDRSLLTNLIVASGLGIYTSSSLMPSISLPPYLSTPLLLSPF